MPPGRAAIVTILALSGVVGCGDEGESPAAPPVLPDGGMAGCPAGETLLDDVCTPAGIPPEACGAGFEADDAGGCRALLPAEPCPAGMIAIPGDLGCREVAPCGEGTWGDIPVEPETHYVDASYPGADSDGSASRPWTSLVSARVATPPGGMIALAAGSYVMDQVLVGHPVRIWGRCPSMVEITASPGEIAALDIRQGMDGTEVHQVALTGPGLGVVVIAARAVAVDRVWVHDTGDRGIHVQSGAAVSIEGSLVERSMGTGVNNAGGDLVLEASVVRDTQPLANTPGCGFVASGDDDAPVNMVIRRSVLEGNRDLGIILIGTVASIEESLVRDTLAAAPTRSGWGVVLQDALDGSRRSQLQMRASVIERNVQVGMFVGASDARVETTVVRDTVPLASDVLDARSVGVEPNPSRTAPGGLTLVASLLERSEVGLFVAGSAAQVDRSVVRHNTPSGEGAAGMGVNATVDPTGQRASLTMTGSVVEGSYIAGVGVDSSDVVLESVVIRDTLPLPDEGTFGRCLSIQGGSADLSASVAELRNVQLERCHESAMLVLGSVVTADSVVVRDIFARPNLGDFGDGIVVMTRPDSLSPAGLTLSHGELTNVARAAVSLFGASLQVSSTRLGCSQFYLVAEVFADHQARLDDGGGNQCSCDGVVEPCRAVSAGLAPPSPLP